MFTSGMSRHPPETFSDLKARNYTLYVTSFNLTGEITNDDYDKTLPSDKNR